IQMRLFRPWIPVPVYAWEATLHGTAIRKPWTQCLARSRFHLERFLSDGIVPADRACKVTIRRSILQLIQPSELWASKHGARRDSGEARDADRVWRAHIYHFAAYRIAWRGSGRRQHPAHDRVPVAARFLRRRLLDVWARTKPHA